MAIYKTQGMQVAIASTFGATKTMSALTNANPGVATLEAAHGVATGDIIEVTSGWRRLDKRVVRAGTVATNDVPLANINTTSTTLYPTGEGIGTVREITGWTSLSQLTAEISVSGGGFRRREVTQIDDIRVKEITLLAEATTITFSAFWDPALAWIAAVEAAAQSGDAFPFRWTIGSAVLYGNARWGFNPEPSIQDGVFVTSIELNTVADSVLYTS